MYITKYRLRQAIEEMESEEAQAEMGSKKKVKRQRFDMEYDERRIKIGKVVIIAGWC